MHSIFKHDIGQKHVEYRKSFHAQWSYISSLNIARTCEVLILSWILEVNE